LGVSREGHVAGAQFATAEARVLASLRFGKLFAESVFIGKGP